jgi:ribosomal protein S18 acetylase RimI-like enzyme
MQIADQATVKAYMYALYRDDPDGKALTNEQIDSTFQRLATHPDFGKILVFDINNQIIGYSLLINFWSNEYGGIILVIDELYITPQYRSRGIGTHFISFLKENKFNDCIALELEVLPYNARALKLYKQIGFKKSNRDYLLLEIK